MRFPRLFSSTFLAAALACGCSAAPPGVQKMPGGADLSGNADLAGANQDLSRLSVYEDLAGADLSTAPGTNSVPLIVDGYEMVPDVGYISVTICVPGTTTCQTIDHIDVDTGSVG